MADIGGKPNVKKRLDGFDDEALAALMTNLGGHCIETLIEAFDSAGDERPTLFIAYTVKGYGLPLAGHKDNHSGMMNPAQMEQLRAEHGGSHVGTTVTNAHLECRLLRERTTK